MWHVKVFSSRMGRPVFEKRETLGSGQRLDFPRVSQRRIKNGDINGMFHILLV
jgi:hypothetical protein